ncbi:MAG: DEAD/DEAH box helicase [Patescibacteria group bacterium]
MTFQELGIEPRLLQALTALKITTPTPIQEKAIPGALEGKDVVGIAQTGTGKTMAFGLPMIQRLMVSTGQGLIVLPTRELALQVDEALRRVGHGFGLRTAVLIGGASAQQQIRMLQARPRIIIGTPGRINDHVQQRTLSLSNIAILVLDEADRMFDMGFAPQIKRIMMVLPRERQTMLFSATMPNEIFLLAKTYMKLPVRIEIARAGTTAETVAQELFVVNKHDKIRLLDRLLTDYHGTVLVFSRTKHGARKIRQSVEDMGHKVAEIHSNRSLGQRKDALEGFKTGKYRVLVATDIAARGIDVSDIEVVINFDVPEHAEDYVHRIGRTGRAGQTGRAITFASPEQKREVQDIQRLTRIWIPVSKMPELPQARATSRPATPDFQQSRRSSTPRYSRYNRR